MPADHRVKIVPALLAWTLLQAAALPTPAQHPLDASDRPMYGRVAADKTGPLDGRDVDATHAKPGYFGVVANEGLSDRAGVRIIHVVADSPAGRAGLRAGDQITTVDGRPIRTMEDLARVMTASVPGRTLRLGVRGEHGPGREISLTLATRPPPNARLFPRFGRVPESVAPPASGPSPTVAPTAILGLRLAPLTEALRRREHLPVAAGVLVTAVAPESAAARAGLPPGAVIVAVNGQPAGSTSRLNQLLAHAMAASPIEITCYYVGQTMRVAVSLERPSGNAGDRQATRPTPLPLPEPATPARRIDQLEQRVDQLEKRIHNLEEKRP